MAPQNLKEQILKISEIFTLTYGNAICSLNYNDPLQLLIATQLAAQCTDKRVNLVTPTLFEKYKNVLDFANANPSELSKLIYSTGFYKNKAKNIIACSQRLISVYNGIVPNNMEDLLTLPGVGRKTANIILGDIYNIPSIVVDTHCIRISNLLGLTKNSDPVKIESDLRKIIPPHLQTQFCHQIVYHGRAYCVARKPNCTQCPVNQYCRFALTHTISKLK